jgi:XRE family transcriptional regulator, fatty acid utilization regulator
VALNQDHIRLIFGLKLKQLRLDKKLSITDLAHLTTLSISYINEIEKGKKYPKSDKIMALAEALGTDYDSLISVKLSKRLEPISVLLQSNILTELPLETFGISPSDLLEMLANAPTKLSAFIGTLIEISRNYNMSVEQFYFSALRTYQEMSDNYFEDIEQEAERFLEEFGIPKQLILDDKYLADILVKNYNYEIKPLNEQQFPELSSVRSLLVQKGNKLRLLINPQLSAAQRAFVMGRELGYQYLKLKIRLNTTHLAEAESFDQLLNNYRASYFASAIIIKGDLLAKKLETVFEKPYFDGHAMIAMLGHFNTTPETFCYRLSNILPKYFGIKQLFFFRFNNYAGQNLFECTKEMHLARKHYPHTIKNEHYCRRWVALTSLQELAESKSKDVICRTQISHYMNTTEQYFVMSFAKQMIASSNLNMSVSMGIVIDENAKSKIKFLDNPDILKREVNETCERCPAFDCKERMAAPTVLQRKIKNEAIQKAIKQLVTE